MKITRKQIIFGLVDGHLRDSDIDILFQQLDSDGDGQLSLPDVIEAEERGTFFHTQNKNIEFKVNFLSNIDGRGFGIITSSDFKDFIRRREQQCKKLFAEIDSFGSGHISANDLKSYLSKEWDRSVSVEEASDFMSQIDTDGSGTIEYAELMDAALLSSGDVKRMFDTPPSQIQKFFEISENEVTVKPPTLGQTVFAGLLAGTLARTATAPFERISIIMRAGCTVHASSSVLGTMASVVRSEGLAALWRGNLLNCFQIGCFSSTYFCTQHFITTPLVSGTAQEPSFLEKFLAGGLAGVVAMTSIYPLFVGHTRLALTDKRRYSGVMDMFTKTITRDGFRSFSHGYGVSALATMSGKGLDMVGILTLREVLVRAGVEPSASEMFFIGMGTSALTTFFCAPLHTVRTRLIAQGSSLGRPMVYHGPLDCMRKVVMGDRLMGLRAEGVRGLFRGVTANVLKICPAVGIQFAGYEMASGLMARYL